MNFSQTQDTNKYTPQYSYLAEKSYQGINPTQRQDDSSPLENKLQEDPSSSLPSIQKGKDLTDLFVDDKLKLATTNLKLLRHQISSRTQIRDDNISGLDYTIVQCESYLLNLDNFPFLGNPLAESKRAALGSTVTKLESEKHSEMVKWWGDLVRVYSNLMEAMAEYQALIRRKQVLKGGYL
jgi:hypothetical protein